MPRNVSSQGVPSPRQTRLRALPWIAPLALLESFTLAIAAAVSWPIVHDVPLMIYSGFAMQELGLVPYRDFFEMNPPGTLYFNAAYYQLAGASTTAFQAVHLSWLAATLAAIAAFVGRWGAPAGVTAAMSFAIAYVGTGRDSAFQREFLLTLPLILSLLLGFPRRGLRSGAEAATRAIFVGLLFGAASTLKPPIAIGLPPVLLALVFACPDRDVGWRVSTLWQPIALRIGIAATLGFMIIPAALALALAANGGLDPFLDIATSYWPLYQEIAGDGRVLTTNLPTFATTQTLARATEYPYLLAAFAGIAACAAAGVGRDRKDIAPVAVVLSWTLCWAFYVYYGGKAWYYHAHPLYATLSLLVGLSVLWLGEAGPLRQAPARIAAAVALFALLWFPTPRQSKPLDLLSVEVVSQHLCGQLEEGDRVLPIDVASGALHSMLRCRAPLAGSFLYGFHFMHHSETEYIQGLRSQWLNEIRSERPRFVIRASGGWMIQGEEGPTTFPALDRLLARHYTSVPLPVRGQLELLERRTTARNSRPPTTSAAGRVQR
jgi:hypothetical protein